LFLFAPASTRVKALASSPVGLSESRANIRPLPGLDRRHGAQPHWERTYQRLEITTGELLPDQEIPLLKSRRELSRTEALKLWAEKRKVGWRTCSPQW